MNTNNKLDLVIAGVGGQGTILASDIIGNSSVLENLPVRAAETHGMAQRGGSVINHVRIGTDLGSMIPEQGADVLLALEPVEAIRYINYLSENGIVVLNTKPVYPVTVTSSDQYPDVSEIINTLKKKYEVYPLDASELAIKAGHPQSMNVVMVGAVSSYLPIGKNRLEECIKDLVPPKTVDINLKAFELGKENISRLIETSAKKP
ncbi:indolepyruvate oxidoreductase subunit beta [Methanohalobium sp.]|uniref:indolepyruvate oxidoreductase subunit beta n=1 Tax=Methanohalobium sp. TaxID=2837493 RepID=UPI0025F5F0AC|nr:indolepyruvate oxidoreductase subunit beta [Methanohalobium sp.]